jgi:hypothetical protein
VEEGATLGPDEVHRRPGPLSHQRRPQHREVVVQRGEEGPFTHRQDEMVVAGVGHVGGIVWVEVAALPAKRGQRAASSSWAWAARVRVGTLLNVAVTPSEVTLV